MLVALGTVTSCVTRSGPSVPLWITRQAGNSAAQTMQFQFKPLSQVAGVSSGICNIGRNVKPGPCESQGSLGCLCRVEMTTDSEGKAAGPQWLVPQPCRARVTDARHVASSTLRSLSDCATERRLAGASAAGSPGSVLATYGNAHNLAGPGNPGSAEVRASGHDPNSISDSTTPGDCRQLPY